MKIINHVREWMRWQNERDKMIKEISTLIEEKARLLSELESLRAVSQQYEFLKQAYAKQVDGNRYVAERLMEYEKLAPKYRALETLIQALKT